MKKLLVFCSLLLVLSLFGGCAKEETVQKDQALQDQEPVVDDSNKELILATTTSTENSGLLDYIIPDFEATYGRRVKVVAVGTGKALEMGRNGEADVLLVHAKASELEFVEENHGLVRYDVMYNDFVLLGPIGQDLISEETNDAVALLVKISLEEVTFVSRGDDSGTHKKELSLWAEASVEPSGDWYVSAGKGMGDTISMANEMQGYTMSDRATYLSRMHDLDLEIVGERDPLLFNQYGVIPVNPEKNDLINSVAADEFVEWLLGDTCQSMIKEFGVDIYGQPLFIPNAEK